MTSSNLATAFEKSVEQNKDRVAVTYAEESLRYGELNEKANQLAGYLLSLHGLPNERCSVALLTNHNPNMIVAMLGVLKAGMTYVPLEPSYPRERLANILKDSQAKFLVTDDQNVALAYELVYTADTGDMTVIDIADVGTETLAENWNRGILEDTEAYMMYTSGSTGKPKGVLQSHKNILAITRYFAREIDLDFNDKVLLTTSYTHTVSVIDIFCALLHGACVCLYDVKNSANKELLLKWSEQQEVTIIHTVPTLFRFIADSPTSKSALSTVRIVILGGEDVLKSDVALYKENFGDDCVFVNLYGQSEVLIAAMQVLDKSSAVVQSRASIGFPLEIMGTKIINQQYDAAQVFEEGELVIISQYITSGYINPENPSRIVTQADGTKMLYTGDIVRLLPDGSMEFSGRKDAMVKINGNRVDPFEIEVIINDCVDVRRSLVVYTDNQLLAFCETQTKTLDAGSIRAELKKKLPDFMIPTNFIQVDQFPLTPNGKTDRQALLARKTNPDNASADVLNDTELAVLEIWKGLFTSESISVYDNFFQLGGNSLLATEMINKIFLEFECELELNVIFENQTIRELAKTIELNKNVLNKFQIL